MVKSKGWNWNVVDDEQEQIWKNPCIESYYLLNRWSSFGMKDFLDLGCGIGRHSVMFSKNDFNVSCFDISEKAIKRTKEWCEDENLTCTYNVGDMLELPYEDNSFDCIMCRNVISHTDTEGIKKIIRELKRVLKDNGECYLTLGSKDSWGFKSSNWPNIDNNTKLRKENGPENNIPHFYADADLCNDLFSSFNIIDFYQTIEYYKHNNIINSDEKRKLYHYHLLIKKIKF